MKISTLIFRFLPKKAGRAAVWFIAAGILAFQACDQLPSKHSLPPHTQSTVTSPAFVPTKEISASKATNFSECKQFFAAGKTPIVNDAPALRELCYEAFAILHNGSTRTPVFVAQRLNRSLLEQGKGLKRTDRFFADARLPADERAQLSDYKNSGLDRGHMAPAGDMHNMIAMDQSFSLANMVPQVGEHNSGAWKKIETDTRQYALRAKGDVFVITGPVFTNEETTPSNRVKVPSQLFKLVYDIEKQEAWAHWHDNAIDVKAGLPISYIELKRRIGIELLPGILIKNTK